MARESSRKTKGRATEAQARQTEFDARLEYEQNKPRFGLLQPKNEKQRKLLHKLQTARLVFVRGPAGTGKTFVTTSWAVEELENGNIDCIVITRPAVGCDEDLGFLPGTEEEKFEGWVAPFMDILTGKLGKKKVESYIKFGKIVIRPLGRMRGLTFRQAVVLLDEAQNTTAGQMKMFLTRIGDGARVVVGGDLEQTDLPRHVINGLADTCDLFKGSEQIAYVDFNDDDSVRDPLVKDILGAYRARALSVSSE